MPALTKTTISMASTPLHVLRGIAALGTGAPTKTIVRRRARALLAKFKNTDHLKSVFCTLVDTMISQQPKYDALPECTARATQTKCKVCTAHTADCHIKGHAVEQCGAWCYFCLFEWTQRCQKQGRVPRCPSCYVAYIDADLVPMKKT
jgi:hypothetical protein